MCVWWGLLGEGELGCGLNVCVLLDLFNSFIKLLQCNSPQVILSKSYDCHDATKDVFNGLMGSFMVILVSLVLTVMKRSGFDLNMTLALQECLLYICIKHFFALS